MSTPNILKKIIAHKQAEIANRKRQFSLEALSELAEAMPPPRSLAEALRGKDRLSVIAEIKKASPSAGVLRQHFDHVQIARAYLQNGADALSVLTDEAFFQGHLDFIRDLGPESPVPILRKDFLIDRYQIFEARTAGADAVLLIVAALTPPMLAELLQTSTTLGMDVLVEVHTRAELRIALQAGADIVGINNRSLETFAVDLATTEQLAPHIPQKKIIVAESGLSHAGDLDRMRKAGVDAVLVGSHFMRQPDPGAALAAFKELCN